MLVHLQKSSFMYLRKIIFLLRADSLGDVCNYGDPIDISWFKTFQTTLKTNKMVLKHLKPKIKLPVVYKEVDVQ